MANLIIKIDLWQDNIDVVRLQQSEDCGRKLEFQIHDNKDPYDISSCKSVSVLGLRSDGQPFRHTGTITKAKEGWFYYEVKEEAVGAAGILQLQVELILSTGKKLLSRVMNFEVLPSVDPDSVFPDTEYGLKFKEALDTIDNLLERYKELDEAREKLTNLDNNLEFLQTSIDNAATSAKEAKVSEESAGDSAKSAANSATSANNNKEAVIKLAKEVENNTATVTEKTKQVIEAKDKTATWEDEARKSANKAADSETAAADSANNAKQSETKAASSESTSLQAKEDVEIIRDNLRGVVDEAKDATDQAKRASSRVLPFATRQWKGVVQVGEGLDVEEGMLSLDYNFREITEDEILAALNLATTGVEDPEGLLRDIAEQVKKAEQATAKIHEVEKRINNISYINHDVDISNEDTNTVYDATLLIKDGKPILRWIAKQEV